MAAWMMIVTEKNAAGALLSVSLGLIFIGIIYSYIMKNARCSACVDAEVIEVTVTRGSRSGTMYKPVYQYYYDGKSYTVIGLGYFRDIYGRYTTIPIWVDPDQPDVIFDKFTWKRYMMTFLPLLLFLLIAGIYAASGK